MGSLKEDHSYLYKRVRLKAIVHTALGLCLLLFPSQVPQSTAGAVTTYAQQSFTFFGIIYLLIGLGIAIGLFLHDSNHRFLRTMMTVAAVWNLLWSFLLVAILLDKPNRSTGYISVIYWYLTYNIWYVRNDPGWNAIKIVRGMTEDERSTNIPIQ